MLSGLPSAFPILGPGQRDIPVSLTFANLPIYTGGRLLRNIDAAGAQLGAQQSEEFRTALDLKLTVGEAYVGVLRARKNLEVARSNVEQLTSFARDVSNRREQGWRFAATNSPRRSRWPMPGLPRSSHGPRSSRRGRRITDTSAAPSPRSCRSRN